EWRDGGPAQSEVLAVLVPSFDEVKGIAELVAQRLGHAERVEYEATQPRDKVEHPGRTAAIVGVSGEERTQLGRVFEVDPRLLRAFEIKADRVAFALIQLEPLRTLAARVPQVRRIDTLPA